MEGSDLVNLLLGGGLVGTIAALYKGLESFRQGSWNRKDSAVADLERWRRQADDVREWESLQHQWWRDYAGRLVFIIVSKLGHEYLPPKEPYPQHPATEGEKGERGGKE